MKRRKSARFNKLKQDLTYFQMMVRMEMRWLEKSKQKVKEIAIEMRKEMESKK